MLLQLGFVWYFDPVREIQTSFSAGFVVSTSDKEGSASGPTAVSRDDSVEEAVAGSVGAEVEDSRVSAVSATELRGAGVVETAAGAAEAAVVAGALDSQEVVDGEGVAGITHWVKQAARSKSATAVMTFFIEKPSFLHINAFDISNIPTKIENINW